MVLPPTPTAIKLGEGSQRQASIFRCSGSSPFKGEVRRGMGVLLRRNYPIPTP